MGGQKKKKRERVVFQMSFQLVIEEELLDNIGTVLNKQERERAKQQRIQELRSIENRAWRSGYDQGQEHARQTQHLFVENVLKAEESKRLENTIQYANKIKKEM